MKTLVFDIRSIENANLNELVDQIMDGALDALGEYSDIGIEQAPTTIMGAGDPPTHRVLLEFPANEDGEAQMAQLLQAIKELVGSKANITISQR